jgi:arylsulfatase A-like enzyme
LPLLCGECEEIHDAVFSEIANGDNLDYMVRGSRWKWYTHSKSGAQCLFDMENDPQEMHNCANLPEHADTLQRLRERLLTFLMKNQVNHARGYQILFDRMGIRFPTEDPDERKRIIRERLRDVHR